MSKIKIILAGLLFIMGAVGCIPKDKRVEVDHADAGTAVAGEIQFKDISVGYCTPSLNAPFYVALEQAIKNKARSYGMQYLSTDGQGDIAKQVMAVEDLLARDIDILILNPLDPKALAPIVQAADQKGVPVFIVDSYIDDSSPFTGAVFANNELNGEILGEWLVRTAGNKELKIALISGNQGNPVGREKRLGFIKGLADAQLHNYGKLNFKVVAQGWGGWSNNGGLKAMEDILVAHPDVNVLLAENDDMAIGALNAITEMGRQDKITILGFDAQKEALQLIIDGKYAATAQNSPSILGISIVDVVAKYLNDKESIKRIDYTPSLLIDKSNAGRYYDPRALF